MDRNIEFFLRRTFFRALYFVGVGHLLKFINNRKLLVPILLFHRVSDNSDPYWSPLSNDSFRKIISFFGKQYKYRQLDELFRGNIEEIKSSCFIVFDDAYRDFLENVVPYLNEHKVPVTMFVPTESVETGTPIWTTWLNVCISETNAKQIVINIGKDTLHYDISDKDAKIAAAKELTTCLKKLSYEKFSVSFKEIIDQTGERVYKKNIEVMSWSEINNTKLKIDYQSHTVTHPMLENIEEADSLTKEIKGSRMIMENKLGIPIKYISYPIGSYSERVTEEAKKHYEAAFAVDARLVNLRKIKHADYRYRIPRFNVSDSDPYELFFRINGFHKLFGR